MSTGAMIFLCVLVLVLAAYKILWAKNFFDICIKGTPQQVEAAIKNGADVNAKDNDGWTALMWYAAGVLAADENPNLKVIALLLKSGTGVNAIDIVQERLNASK